MLRNMPNLPAGEPQPQQRGPDERKQKEQGEGDGGRAGGVCVWHV